MDPYDRIRESEAEVLADQIGVIAVAIDRSAGEFAEFGGSLGELIEGRTGDLVRFLGGLEFAFGGLDGIGAFEKAVLGFFGISKLPLFSPLARLASK